VLVRVADDLMSWLCEVLIYLVKADDFPLPSFWINKSLNPAEAAVEAAPIRKLWLENQVDWRPTLHSATLKWAVSWPLDKGVPSWKINKGPGVGAGGLNKQAWTTWDKVLSRLLWLPETWWIHICTKLPSQSTYGISRSHWL